MSFPRRLSKGRSSGSLPGRHSRTGSFSDDASQSSRPETLDPPILVYHESARSIVFRDHLRRAVRNSEQEEEQASRLVAAESEKQEELAALQQGNEGDFLTPLPHKPLFVVNAKKELDKLETFGTLATELLDFNETTVRPSEAGIPERQIGNFQPRIVPLPSLDFGPDDEFEPLLKALDHTALQENNDWTAAEAEVVQLFQTQHCAVKMIKNSDWAPFLHRFCYPEQQHSRRQLPEHADIAPHDQHIFNSFVTSTTILPPDGLNMRCYGSTNTYTVGVVFGLPAFDSPETENEATTRSQTWSWPSGYSAKTEFNIDSRGRLINGRQEALLSLSTLRQYNDDYLTKDEYMIGQRVVQALSQVPYNEVYLRVGGVGRLVPDNEQQPQRSLDCGVGLPVALIVRTAKYGHLISLLRTRARLMHCFGEHNIKGIPLLLVTPETGVRVLTEALQRDLWKIAARNLNPFQNPSIAHKTTMANTEDNSFQQKVDELLHLDESIQDLLTPEELARIAGGFGATDESVATILKKAMIQDRRLNKKRHSKSHKLQDIVNEGLASALRSGDYHTSRQLLILYSLVASQGADSSSSSDEEEDSEDDDQQQNEEDDNSKEDSKKEKKAKQLKKPGLDKEATKQRILKHRSSLGRDAELIKRDVEAVSSGDGTVSSKLPAPPPPPPLDTDRLRSATNSDGLLAVLGAAQVLRAMQDGSAKIRVQEAVDAVDEWVNYGEQSVAFRISSWYDQRAAQGDLKIATEQNSSFMAFVSNKAISNRKAFAQQLREAISVTDFTDIRFLHAIGVILGRMHSPCLRLELLQYVLGLDNRYSVAHVARSVELAATCLDISVSR
jgi:hypothetical protein